MKRRRIFLTLLGVLSVIVQKVQSQQILDFFNNEIIGEKIFEIFREINF